MNPDRHVHDALVAALESGADLHALLQIVLNCFQCDAGTIHSFEKESQTLNLRASIGIPDMIIEKVRAIPIGKGMAGLAAVRRECVSLCNLQTDDSGAAQPAARMTGLEGSIAVPMLVESDLRGVLGIAKSKAYNFGASEKMVLLEVATLIGERYLPGTIK